MYAPEALTIQFSTTILAQLKNEYINKQNEKINSKLWGLQQEEYTLKYEIFHNFKEITVSNGKEYYKDKISTATNKLKDLELEKDFLERIDFLSKNLLQTLNDYQEILYFGYKFLHKEISLPAISIARESVSNMENVIVNNIIIDYSSNNENARVKKVFEVVNSPLESKLHKSLVDKPFLTISNFNIKLKISDNKFELIVKIDNLNFELGKIYAFTGLSGCGKTSTMLSIKDDLYGVIQAEGNISLPKINDKEPLIFLLTQKLYLPYNTNLLETIYYPNILPKEPEQALIITKKIIKLLNELKFRGFDFKINTEKEMLDKLYSKEFSLSGGETTKVMLTSAILVKPDILLIDETFKGLDPSSKLLAQQLIKKHLPNSLIIVVTHDEIITSFYHQRIHFDNKGVTLMDTPSENFYHFEDMKEENIEEQESISGEVKYSTIDELT